jgi:hypothetical protein
VNYEYTVRLEEKKTVTKAKKRKQQQEIGNNTAHHCNAGRKNRKLMRALTEQTKRNTN